MLAAPGCQCNSSLMAGEDSMINSSAQEYNQSAWQWINVYDLLSLCLSKSDPRLLLLRHMPASTDHSMTDFSGRQNTCQHTALASMQLLMANCTTLHAAITCKLYVACSLQVCKSVAVLFACNLCPCMQTLSKIPPNITQCLH